MIKASVELLEALGVKAEADFSAALLNRLNADNARIEALQSRIGELTASVTRIDEGAVKLTESLGAVSGKVESIKFPNLDEVKALATDAGSLAAATALGKVGISPVAPQPTAEAIEQTPEAKADEMAKAGKFEDAYAASPKLQAEFSSAAVYAAYAKAVARNGVRVLTK